SSVGRPERAQYHVSAHDGGAAPLIDLSLLLADRHDTPIVFAPAVAGPSVKAVIGTDMPDAFSVSVMPGSHIEAPAMITADTAPVQMAAIATGEPIIRAPVAQAADATDFATVGAGAFRGSDGSHLVSHEVLVPFHETPP